MVQETKSLTATIHIRFHYEELELGPVTESEAQLMDSLLAHAGDLAPELQELLVKFTCYLKGFSGNGRAKKPFIPSEP